MASTGDAGNVDTTSEVDKGEAEALARDAGGGDGPSRRKGDARAFVDKAVQTDPPVEQVGKCPLTRHLAVLCWQLAAKVVLWTQVVSTGEEEDSFVSFLPIFLVGCVTFTQLVFEATWLLTQTAQLYFRSEATGKVVALPQLLLKEIVFIPISALAAWGLWSLKWSSFVYKICRSNGVGSILVATLMNDFYVVDKCRLSVGIYGKADAFTSLCFILLYAYATVVSQMLLLLDNNSPQPPSKTSQPNVAEGHQEEPKNSSGRFQVPWEMLAIFLLQAIVLVVDNINLALVLRFDAQRRHEFWRFLTVSLVHGWPGHLWGNMRHQLVPTFLLQVVHSSSPRSVVGIYLFGILGGSFASSLLLPHASSVGSSGGGFALHYAFFFTFLLKGFSKLPPQFRATLFASLARPQLVSFLWLTTVVHGIFCYFRHQHGFSENEDYIGHVSHFGGAVAGVLGALLVYLKDTPEDVRLKNAVKVYAGLLIVGVLGVNVFLPGNYLKTEWNVNYVESFVRGVIRQHRVYVDVNGTCSSPCAYNAIRSLNWTGGWDAPYTNNFNPFFCRK